MIPIVIFFCLAVGFLVYAGQVQPVPDGLILMLFAVIFASAGISEYWRWLRLANAEVKKRNKVAERAGDLDVIMAEKGLFQLVLQANPEQLKVIHSMDAVIICQAGAGDPTYQLQIDDYRTRDWTPVEEYLARCTPTHLAPVGWWSEGTEMRTLAQKINGLMVAKGYAEPAAGNRPARWLNRAGGLRAIGLEGG